VKAKYSLRSWRGKYVKERERERGRLRGVATQFTSWKLVGVFCHGIFMYFPLFMQLCLAFLILTRDVLMYRHLTRVQQITCKSKVRLAFTFLTNKAGPPN
jgi:hypothetical protein